jgi:hypothetical protein
MRAQTIALLAVVTFAGACQRAESRQLPVAIDTSSDSACYRVASALVGYQSPSGWGLVTRRELLASDAELWTQYHDNTSCPGIAAVNLDGGPTAYAITEIMRRDGRLFQRLVVYRPESRHIEVVSESRETSFPSVVYRFEGHRAVDFYSGAVTRFSREAFVFEHMESWAIVYYADGSALRHVLISD